jgi:hypothetical protein
MNFMALTKWSDDEKLYQEKRGRLTSSIPASWTKPQHLVYLMGEKEVLSLIQE